MIAGRAAALAVLAALAAGPALALSCAYMMAEDVFHSFNDRPETYVAVYGTFSQVRKVRHDHAQDRVIWSASFQGASASARAFDRPFAAEVEIVQPLWTGIDGGAGDPDGLGEWLPGTTGIVYMEKRAGGFRITAELCRSLVDTEGANIAPTLDCLAGRRCPRSP